VLRGRGGREGESQGAHGDVELTNTGRVACTLHGIPRVEILTAADGLLVQLVRPES
jgi:Protein of unknown function (DUF4232)